MQTLVQTQKMDQLEQEVHELRREVTVLQAEVEKLTSLVSSLTVTQDQPLCPKRPRQQVPRQVILQNQVPQQFILHNQVRRASKFDPIPMKYADLLPILLKKNLVQTRPSPQVPDVLPIWYRSDLFCAFHQGAPGHDIEQCQPLKEEVQKLIENNAWSFDDPDLKVLNQQQYPTSHFLAAAVQNSGYQPQS